MDIVISRVTSPTDFTSSPRNRHTSRSWSIRSAGRREPTVGGVVISRGPSTSARPPIHASHCSIASASCLENLANSS